MDRPAAPISRPAPKASKVKTLDLSEVVSADQAIIDAKKKEAEDLVKDQEKKKRELEEKRQAAREQKEREQEERRLQREKEQEERRLKRERERLEKEAKELERREIVERKRKAQEEQEEARKRKFLFVQLFVTGYPYRRHVTYSLVVAKTDGSQMPGSAPTAKRSSADPVEAFDSKRPKLSYPTPVQPVQIQPVQPLQPLQPVQQPVGVTPLMYQPIAQYATASGSPMPLLSNAGMMQYQPAAPQPLEQPIVSALVAPPAPPDLDAVIGPDTPLLTAENRELIRNFLSGRYERSKDKAEIKLSEAVIPDQVTGAMWVHTLFIVLDYDLCKWRKIKRRKKVA
ncbi:hypothetical protein DFJ73DRAFT_107396 [Zopfochytrium polystomum]|nr:hypothetical protein DFJ73DRAFT_107396 [Zopfochytrium polystomum]